MSRKSRSGLGVATILVLALTNCEPTRSLPSDQQKSGENKSEIAECRVLVDAPRSKGIYVELCITDLAIIDEVVLGPIAKATHNRRPAKWPEIGSIRVIKKDGSRQEFRLFVPWGNFAQGEDYFSTDFTKLRSVFRGALNRSKECVEIGGL